MSKVICDICGTSFPDTATQCPICGSVRPADAPSVNDDRKEKSGGYKHVKGGNFSKSNVRKRNKAKGVVSVNVVSDMDAEGRTNGGKSNKALVIVAIILLLAVIAVAAYIILNYFGPSGKPSGNQGGGATESTPAATDETIPCEDLRLSNKNILFESAEGTSQLLSVEVTPANTTDLIRFSSEDESIATVSDSGLVTPVAPGKTKIIVECGQFRAECVVECNFEDPNEETTEATESTEESTEPSIDPNEELRLNRKDFTLDRKGATWTLYSGKIPLNVIKWTSDNANVATFENGVVTAVGEGKAVVTAEFNGQKVSCDVHCRFKEDSAGVGGSGGNIGEDGGVSTPSTGSPGIYNPWGSNDEATEPVGASFTLSFKDASGNMVSSVSWSSQNTACCTVAGGTVSCVGAGEATIVATYNGQDYYFKVNVY